MKNLKCKRYYFVALLVLLSMSLVLVGCGGSKSTEAPPAPQKETADTANESTKEEVKEWAPTKPIEYIAPANPGGGWDTLARTTAKVLEETKLSPQALPVVNKPGGGGAVGWAYMSNHVGDAHKLFVTSPPIILVPLNGNSEYDHTDFTPVARLITDYMIVAVKADSPYQTIEELMEALKQNPESISIAGGSAPGSMDHIAVAGAAYAAGVNARDVNYIPFSGGGEAITALLGGHVDVVSTGVGESTPHVEAGEIRILAVSSPERLALLPDVPTYKDAGIDFTFDLWRGVMAPKDISPEALQYYEKLFFEMQQTTEWAEARDQLAWSDAYQNSEEFGKFLDEQQVLFKTILSDIGLID
jgi:putative tricarboxylic transport membrane protein